MPTIRCVQCGEPATKVVTVTMWPGPGHDVQHRKAVMCDKDANKNLHGRGVRHAYAFERLTGNDVADCGGCEHSGCMSDGPFYVVFQPTHYVDSVFCADHLTQVRP